MLPKIIHYCWFGGSEIPDNYKNLIAEWKTLHPDWLIKRWDESNSPMSLPYIQNAIEHNNWANISNYVRLYALRTEGGIYLDTDMKVLQPLNQLLSHECFLGFESGNTESADFWVNNAIMGTTPYHPFVKECEQYLLSRFDGTEQANLSSPHLVTNILKNQYGLKKYGRQLLDNIMLYEKEVFYPIPVDKVYLLKEVNTYPAHTIAVHLWGRTWFTNEMLLEEMDNLRKYTHELNDYIEKMTKDLNQSREELVVANTRLTEVQNENATFKFLATDFLKKIEASQLTLEKSSIETNRQINQLINDIKTISAQQAVMNQQLDALRLLYKK